MDADGDFGIIEQTTNKLNYIFSPHEYAKVMREARNTNKFTVTEMEQMDFKNWEILAKQTSKRKCKIGFSKCCYFRFSKAYMLGYGCGDSYDKYLVRDDVQISMVKGRRGDAAESFDLSTFNVPQAYSSPLQLSPEKLSDLRILVSEWVPQAVKRVYWDRLFASQGSGTDNPDAILDPEPENTSDPDAIDPETSANEDQGGYEDELSTDDDVDTASEPEEPLLTGHLFDYA